MKYRAALPQHNDNISHEHPLKDFLLILLALSLAVLAGIWAAGLLVDRVVDGMRPETEARLTRLLAPPLPPTPAEAAPRQAWLQTQVDALRRCAGFSGPVNVRLVMSRQANAVVLPGGTVLVYAGMFEQLKSENGLAFVLAHELSHLVHRDHLRAVGRSLVVIAAATVLTGDGSWAAGVLTPAQHLGETSQSRERESQADANALRILQCRYGHVGGATEFFEAIRGRDGDAPAIAHYMGSHPSMTARITSLQHAMRQAGLHGGPVLPLPR
ncbi:MAG: M48 family metallopeptidase [Lysobacteraceae bacterium]|nr:MAG: M48 family metallopeptidase [Xanthomonadaceae bacterium]